MNTFNIKPGPEVGEKLKDVKNFWFDTEMKYKTSKEILKRYIERCNKQLLMLW